MQWDKRWFDWPCRTGMVCAMQILHYLDDFHNQISMFRLDWIIPHRRTVSPNVDRLAIPLLRTHGAQFIFVVLNAA